MSTPLEQLHERCETMQQALIDLISAVRDLTDSEEWFHLHVVLEAAMVAVQEDVPPQAAGDTSEETG